MPNTDHLTLRDIVRAKRMIESKILDSQPAKYVIWLGEQAAFFLGIDVGKYIDGIIQKETKR